MRVVIVGAGQTGSQLARYLVQGKHDVSLIECDGETARHASNRIDCLFLHDTGTRIESLEEAGIAKADALVCVTESDEKNMIICGLAASRYPELVKIARVRNAGYTMLIPGTKNSWNRPFRLSAPPFSLRATLARVSARRAPSAITALSLIT